MKKRVSNRQVLIMLLNIETYQISYQNFYDFATEIKLKYITKINWTKRMKIFGYRDNKDEFRNNKVGSRNNKDKSWVFDFT